MIKTVRDCKRVSWTMIIITSSAWFVKLDVGFEYISIISYYDRADSVLALAGKYSRIHVRQWVPVKHVFNSIFR
jgi:hypothetical protein